MDRDLSGQRIKSTIGSRVKVKTSGYAIYKKGGYGRFIGMTADDAREAFKTIEQLKGLSVDYIKVINSGVFMPESGLISNGGFTREEIREIISYATDSGFPVFCHANGDVAIRDAVEAGASSIVHGFCVSEDTLALMKDKRASLIPTLNALSSLSLNSVSSEARKNIDIMTERHLSAMSRAKDLGVCLFSGSDSGALFLPYGTSYLKELLFFEKAGLSIKQILSASVTGELQEGLRADFIILNGLNVEAVFVNGIPVSRNTVF
ncbi:MAG: amidohydrolase family protein [Nitrospirota bacterium]